ncbi:hypothetical protein HYALB_00003769 [Hymenoscyphus albidus]|uniref:Uncharacterized protein n=1 Tax=Hymenoscyphus albidus TaxID=595503 RepID=A0A9N9LT98_9HELO|nr:hypothetical protein HYALB_00003769 [Hymenoscyphus albidus]
MSNFHRNLPSDIQPRFRYGRALKDSSFERWVEDEKFKAKKRRSDHPAKLSITDTGDAIEFTGLMICGHSPIDLASLLDSYFARQDYIGRLGLRSRKSNLSPMQHEAIRDFQATTEAFLTGGRTLDDGTMLEVYFRIFDNLFFNGTLENLCSVSLTRNQHFVPLGQIGPPKTTSQFAMGIEIRDLLAFPRRWEVFPLREWLASYIETLLHEMLHAFFMIYSCPCTSCNVTNKSAQGLGLAGHGESWLRAALQLELAAKTLLRVHLLSGLFSFGRTESAEFDTALSLCFPRGPSEDLVQGISQISLQDGYP